jgi:chromosome segregation ATPase
MCFGSSKPKRDPKVDEQLKKQEAEAEEAKKKAAQEAADAKAAATERLRQEQSAPMSQGLNRQKEKTKAVKSLISTDTDAAKAVTAARTGEETTEEPVSFAQSREERLKRQKSALGPTGRQGRRSGSRGRRSLITGMGGGIGYYNRFFS